MKDLRCPEFQPGPSCVLKKEARWAILRFEKARWAILRFEKKLRDPVAL